MNENCFNSQINLPRQEGAVLIVALILLVVMTMLGISGMEATKLETRMAANVHDYNQAFQTAEAGLAWTFNACAQDLLSPIGFEAIAQITEQFIPVPCNGDNEIIPPRNTRQISGGIEARANGNMREIVYLVKSQGRSADVDDDPEAITVTLVGGMMLSGALDNRTLMQVGQPQAPQACDLGDAGTNACSPSADPSIDVQTNCANAIIGLIDPSIAQCDNQLISQACGLNPALDCNALRNSVPSPP